MKRTFTCVICGHQILTYKMHFEVQPDDVRELFAVTSSSSTTAKAMICGRNSCIHRWTKADWNQAIIAVYETREAANEGGD